MYIYIYIHTHTHTHTYDESNGDQEGGLWLYESFVRKEMNIGTIIKKLRHQRDLTQEQLAEYLNVSVSAVSQWESGKTVPDVSTLLALANFFDVTLDELFDRTSKEKEREMEKYHSLDREYANHLYQA